MSLRPEVAWFAEQMEAQLKANDHKGGWMNLSFDYFTRRIDEEVEELVAAIPMLQHDDDEVVAELICEAADVANFALMIADVARKRYAERTTPHS